MLNNANVNIFNIYHLTAIHYASVQNSSGVVDLLLERGVGIDTAVVDGVGGTPLQFNGCSFFIQT